MNPHWTIHQRFISKLSIMAALTCCLVMAFSLAPAKAVGTITVNSLTDVNAIDAVCTLREAIIAARSDGDYQGCTGGTGSGDTIGFSVTGRITLSNSLGALPDLLNSTTIDGTTAPGYVMGGTPLIIIDGVNLGANTHGISIFTDNNVVKGLAIVNFKGNGIWLSSMGASGTLLTSNYVGTANGTTAEPNNVGVRVDNVALNSNVLVGGLAANLGNVISGNTTHGVHISNTSTMQVNNNRIGVNSSGTGSLPNGGYGIYITGNSASVTVGGAAAQSNIIGNNGSAGIFNEGTGKNNTFVHNRIFNNGGLGVDLAPLGVNANDLGDGDSGVNDLLNYPVITAATWANNTLTVVGTMNTTANTNYTLQFFVNSVCDASGNGEGEVIPTTSTLNRATNASGNDSYTHNMTSGNVIGYYVTVTATVISVGTSEFSVCVLVQAPSQNTPTPTPTQTPTATSTPIAGEALLINGGFELDPDLNQIPDGWTQKNPTGDKRKCNKEGKIIAFEGECVYQFKSAIGENSTLEQTVDLVANDLNVGDTLILDGVVNAKGIVKTKVKLRITYANTTLSKGKITLNITTPLSSYTPFSALSSSLEVVLADEPTKVSLKLQNQGTSGNVRYDMISLTKAYSLLALPTLPR